MTFAKSAVEDMRKDGDDVRDMSRFTLYGRITDEIRKAKADSQVIRLA